MTKKVHIDIVARDKTKRAVGTAKKSLGGLKSFALAAGAALATIGAGRAITNLVNVGKSIESLQIRFKLLFGSAEEGAKAFDTLTSFASKVPFSLEDIAAASGNLAVVAKDAKQLQDILEITGNVAGATGLDFQTTASQIQRAFAGGIASADIFREKGVRDMLGFSAGAKVSVEETREAFNRVFAGNGEFAKTTEELANTLEGTLSMINDKFFNFKRAINEAFFEELKSQFGDLNEFLDANEEAILGFGRDIGTGLATALKETVESVQVITSGLDLLARVVETADAKTSGFTSTILQAADPLHGIKELLKLFAQENENLSTTLDNLLPRAEVYTDQIMRLAEGYGVLSTKIEEETSPAIQELSQDVLDLQEALMPLGNAFDTAFATADQKLEESEANRKRILENATKNFKDAKFKEIDFQKMSQKEAQQLTRAGFRQSLQEGAKHNKALFRINQAMNIAEAIMNTATGVTSALKLGPIIGPPLALAIGAMGAVQVATIAAQQPPAQFGGVRVANQPFLVGAQGPELFTPATAGTVTPNHQLESAPTHIVFNINTVDAKGFGALLDTRKAQIVNMINSARNQKGQSNIV